MDIIDKLLEQYDQLKNTKNTKALSKWCPTELLDLTTFLPCNTPTYVRIWHLRNRVFYIPSCENCGSPTQFDRTDGCYRRFCSKACAARDSNTKQKKASSTERIYGNRSYFQTDDYHRKARATSLSKYGVEVPSASPIVRAKIESTNLSLYGHRSTLSVPDVQDKIKKTLLDRYGVANPMHVPEIVAKTTENTRTAYAERLQEILDRRYRTNLDRYGRYDPAQLHMSMDMIDLSYNRQWLQEQNAQYPLCYIAKKLGMGTSQLSVRFNKLGLVPVQHAISSHHQFILDHLRSKYYGEICINDRKVLNGMELDIVLPELNLAIEIDGVYWHGELGGNKPYDYHLEKTRKCAELGIRLVHIWDTEIADKLDIVKSRLDNLLGVNSNRIGARKLVVTKISNDQAATFHNQNHLSGAAPANQHYALASQDGVIYMCMSIGHSRYDKTADLEIIRSSTRCGIVIPGGVSKLINAVGLDHFGKKIITYSDLRWGPGLSYGLAGFSHVKNTGPGYWYVKAGKVYHRSGFQKRYLVKKLDNFDPNLSEWENMRNHGWDRIWDCGNAVWEKLL